MFRKFLIILVMVLFAFNAHAGSDGELTLKKNNPSEIKDCFENLNRATFAFNQAIDGVLFKPVASAYKILPQPIRTGVSNSLDNLSNSGRISSAIISGSICENNS